MSIYIMGASHSVEPDVPVLDAEDPEPEVDTEPEEEVVEEMDDIHWLWPFI
jgi:hypothetical protein